MKFCFCIPTYNATVLNARCLDSLRKYHPDADVIINDDGSSEEVQKLLVPIAKKYNAKLLLNKHNYGFSYSVNRMMDASDADVVILCNNDVIFTQEITEKTKQVFDQDEKIGVAGYLLYYQDGRIQHAGHVRLSSGLFGHYFHGQKDIEEAHVSHYNIGVTGALMAIRKSMLDKIGVFSPRYKLSCEDTEFCLRTWHCGYRVYYIGDVSAIHAEGKTRGANDEQKKAIGTYEQDRESIDQFFTDLKRYNIPLIQRDVDKAEGVETKYTVVFKRTGALGDCVMLTGVIKKYRELYPDHYIIVLTHCPYPFEHNKDVDAVVSDLIGIAFDDIFDFDMAYEDNPDKSVWEAYADVMKYKKDEVKPVLYDYYKDGIDLVNLLGKEKININDGSVWTVLHPAVSWACKTLPKSVWEEVVDGLVSKGHKIIVVGTDRDYKLNKRANLYDFRNITSLGAIRILIDHCALFVGLDSGLMHLALTTDTPVIGVFTTADPDKFIHRKDNTVSVIPNTECKFCRHKTKGVTHIECDTNECVKSITSKDILECIK